MNDPFGLVQPWIGLIDAVGVAVVFVVWQLVRGAKDRTRQIVAAFGAVALAMALTRAVSGVAAFTALLGGGFPLEDDGRPAADLLLVAAGVVAGVAAVLALQRRADDAAEDLAADAADTAELDPDEAEGPDPYVVSRQRLVAAAPWFDLGVLALALALPVVSYGFLRPGGYAPYRDVTVALVASRLLTGFLAGAPLLVLARRDDGDRRVFAAAAALVAFGLALVPLWPGGFGNEFWAAFAAGLVPGLLAGVALRLLAAAVPEDRSAAAIGVALAVVLVGAVTWASSAVVTQHTVDDGVFEHADLGFDEES